MKNVLFIDLASTSSLQFYHLYRLNISCIASYHSNGTHNSSQTRSIPSIEPRTCILAKTWLTVAEKHRHSRNFLRGNHLGRHLEYLKFLKGDTSTPPQISLYTTQGRITKRKKNYIRDFGVTPLGYRTKAESVLLYHTPSIITSIWYTYITYKSKWYHLVRMH